MKLFKPEDLDKFTYVSAPVISEDGKRVACVKKTGEKETGTFPASVWLYDPAGGSRSECGCEEAAGSGKATGCEEVIGSGKGNVIGNEICLTPEGEQWMAPCFLKNSDYMTYLCNRTGSFQIYVRSLETGAERKLTSLRHGILRYRVSADETALVYETTVWPEEIREGNVFTEMSAEETAEWKAEMDMRPCEATDLVDKMDEWYGMRKGETSHIGTAAMMLPEEGEADSGNYTANCIPGSLIDTGMESVRPVWSHDSSEIAFYAYPYGGAKGRTPELFLCNADGSKVRQISHDQYLYIDSAPVFTADDSSVVTVVFAMYEDGGCTQMPYAFSVNGARGCQLLDEADEKICHGVNPTICGRTENGENYSNMYAVGDNLYFLSGLNGRTGICRVNMTGKLYTTNKDGNSGANTEEQSGRSIVENSSEKPSVELIRQGDTDIQSFYVNQKGQLAFVQASLQRPGELFASVRGSEMISSEETEKSYARQLSFSNEWLKEYAFGDWTSHYVRSKDGKANLLYYIWHPVGQEAGKKYPAVLDIKGGPETMYSKVYWHEFHALASAGMAVICANPRGSIGFGHTYNAGGICWKQEVVDDFEMVLKDAVSLGFIDEKRIGVTGGSYGGYMTNKLMGRTDWFAAAVTQRSLVNPATSYGTGDMGFISSQEIPEDFTMLEYLNDRARGNIITYVDHMKIPLLILHAFRDYRCSFEQAEQLFIPMKERNPEVPLRLVMFPEENHALTRTGKMHSQIRHLQEMTHWFVKYLIETPWTAPVKDDAGSSGKCKNENSGKTDCHVSEKTENESMISEGGCGNE